MGLLAFTIGIIAFYHGKSGHSAWSLLIGEVDGPTEERFIAHLRDVVRHPVKGQLMVDFAYDISMPTPVQRRRIIEVLQGSDKLHLIAGHAVVVNSISGRGVLTAINWIVRAPFEEQAFAKPEAALSWLRERNPAFQDQKLISDMRQSCPEFDQLTW